MTRDEVTENITRLQMHYSYPIKYATELLDHDAAQRQEIEDLRKQLSESVPRSRYDACNQDWLDAKAKLEQVQQAASKAIEQLEGRVQALEGALEKVLALKNILERAYRGYGTPEEERQKAALAATGEEGKP